MDIGYKVFYKAAFDLTPIDTAHNDILWDIIQEIRSWLTIKYRKRADPLPKETRAWSDWKNGKTIRSQSGPSHFAFVSLH